MAAKHLELYQRILGPASSAQFPAM
jgi:hypothetical protein